MLDEITSVGECHVKGQSSGGALWTPAYNPGRQADQSGVLQQHWIVHVQCLYISCYVTVNKPVLSYLLSRLLPQHCYLANVNICSLLLGCAVQMFQRMIDCTVDNLEAVFAYMNNSRVGSSDRLTHLIHLEAFFSALSANSLTINLERCVFPFQLRKF
jgi:hypothetical protein